MFDQPSSGGIAFATSPSGQRVDAVCRSTVTGAVVPIDVLGRGVTQVSLEESG
ncbi:MAG: hypothetical protein R2706_01610 [Acidimicrobiales bacterium]